MTRSRFSGGDCRVLSQFSLRVARLRVHELFRCIIKITLFELADRLRPVSIPLEARFAKFRSRRIVALVLPICLSFLSTFTVSTAASAKTVAVDGCIIQQETYCYKRNLTGASLRNVNLDGAIFSHSILDGADLSHARLYGARFIHSSLNGVNLTGAFMNEGSYFRSSFVGARFTKASLWETYFSGSDLSHVDLSSAKVGASLYLGDADLSGADLRNPQLWKSVKYTNSQNGPWATGFYIPPQQSRLRGTTPLLPRGVKLVNGYLFGPSADLSGLTVNVQGKDLSSVNLTGISTNGNILGKPARLPRHWVIRNGFLLGPGVNLGALDTSRIYRGCIYAYPFCPDMRGVDLSGALMPDGTIHS